MDVLFYRRPDRTVTGKIRVTVNVVGKGRFKGASFPRDGAAN